MEPGMEGDGKGVKGIKMEYIPMPHDECIYVSKHILIRKKNKRNLPIQKHINSLGRIRGM